MRVLAILMGGTKTEYALFDESGNFKRIVIPTPNRRDGQEYFAQLIEDSGEIDAVSVGAPAIDSNTGQFVPYASNLPDGWAGSDFKISLEKIVAKHSSQAVVIVKSDVYMECAGATLAMTSGLGDEEVQRIMPFEIHCCWNRFRSARSCA